MISQTVPKQSSGGHGLRKGQGCCSILEVLLRGVAKMIQQTLLPKPFEKQELASQYISRTMSLGLGSISMRCCICFILVGRRLPSRCNASTPRRIPKGEWRDRYHRTYRVARRRMLPTWLLRKTLPPTPPEHKRSSWFAPCLFHCCFFHGEFRRTAIFVLFRFCSSFLSWFLAAGKKDVRTRGVPATMVCDHILYDIMVPSTLK